VGKIERVVWVSFEFLAKGAKNPSGSFRILQVEPDYGERPS
jgi:hypothetical protein